MTLPEWIETWLDGYHLGGPFSGLLTKTMLATAVLLVSLIVFYISRRIVRGLVHRLFDRTRITWDDRLQDNQFFMRLTLFIPALIIHLFIPAVLRGHDRAIAVVTGALNIYFITVGALVLDALINWLHDIYSTLRVARDIPLRAFVQVFKIILVGAGLIMVGSVVLNRSPLYLLSGLGAMTAVLMLVFKDPILGFAAGVQLISNRMLKNGDWIEMPKYGADGAVLDITLTTVKVRNWDNTITTIPTYALIGDAFKNWRGMEESHGRRIKRALYIDMNSIRFCTPEALARYAAIGCLSDYLQRKQQEIADHNARLGDQARHVANTRRLTNIGTFRAYASAYLRNHPLINTEMTLMVRQLAPGAHGLPLEVYAFCKDKAWVNYEAVQADIFDHLLAIAGEFELKIFQNPAGADVQRLAALPS
jgi:miniconductance mechanosensitive channel